MKTNSFLAVEKKSIHIDGFHFYKKLAFNNL